MSKIEIWAHRGAPLGRGDLPPENTLTAFRRALEAGADALEFDLHLTRDGHLVVHHDLELCHPRLGQVAVPDLNLTEIREVTLGEQERIPIFQELVDLAREGRVPLIPELKTPDAAEKRGLDPVGALCHQLDELDIYDHVVVQCFHRSTLTQLRRERPNLKLLALYRHDQLVDLNNVPGNAEYLGIPMLSVFFFGRKTVAGAKKVGKMVVPWRDMSLSENPEVFDRLLEFEVDAIMVDDAERALVHYNRVPAPPGYERAERDLMVREEPAHSRRSRKPA